MINDNNNKDKATYVFTKFAKQNRTLLPNLTQTLESMVAKANPPSQQFPNLQNNAIPPHIKDNPSLLTNGSPTIAANNPTTL